MTAKKGHSRSREETFQAPAPKPRARSGKINDAYGLEGSNKTVDRPKPDDEPAQETGNLERSRFIPRTPFSRG